MIFRLLLIVIAFLGIRYVVSRLVGGRSATTEPGNPGEVPPPTKGRVIDVDFTEHTAKKDRSSTD